MVNKLKYDSEARDAILRGISTVAEAVGATLGPRGRNVAIEQHNSTPWVVHDGVTVAKSINPEDPFERQGAKLLIEAAAKTNDTAGDGTTTATILAHALVKECLKDIEAGHNPAQIREELEAALRDTLKKLTKLAKKLTTNEEIEQVATIAAADPTLGRIVAEALDHVGKDGIITVEEGKGFDTIVEYKTGMELDRGYLSPYFVTNQATVEAVIEDPYVLLTDKKIYHQYEILPFLEKFVQTNKNLVIIGDVAEEALAFLVVNRLKGVLNVVALQPPAWGGRRIDELEDIAVLTGGTVITQDSGREIESVMIEELGRVGKVISDRDKTIILNGKGNAVAIDRYCHDLSDQIQYANTDYDKQIKEQRLAKLSGSVAIINVGGLTEPEIKEKKERVIDAVNATKAAVEEGIVAGGEITLLRLASSSSAQSLGARILLQALKSPFIRLITNAGMDYAEVRENLAGQEYPMGIDVIDGKIKNMIEAGIIDPVKVTRCALENAVSIAVMAMTTQVIIINQEESK